MKRTIFAISTYLAKSAIAIIRVSGPGALASLTKFTRLSSQDFTPFKVKLVSIYNPTTKAVVDKPLVVYFPQNKSYTGETLVEYHLHGSLAVIKEFLDILGSQKDHYLAYPGEFTKTALLNNRMSLIEAEALNDFINSETSAQKQQAYNIMSGESAHKYQKWLNLIKENLSLIEAAIDFSEEDLPSDLLASVFDNIKALKLELAQEQDKYLGSSKLKNGLKVAIVGAPNVGKSSLLNFLTKTDTAIVSSTAGTTRDSISAFIDLAGFPVNFIDTAGLRETNNEIEQYGIEKTKKNIQNSDLKILVVSLDNLTETFKVVEPYLQGKYLIVVNKVDLLDGGSTTSRRGLDLLNDLLGENNTGLADYLVAGISLKEEIGLPDFNQKLEHILNNITRASEHPIILNERHKSLVKRLYDSLELFTSFTENNCESPSPASVEGDYNVDLVIQSEYLRNAMSILGELLGLHNIEDLLDEIFGKFCIGK